ncbi:hypothetical protein MBLNU459_g8415t1 [Dothideomycetes sp. NU459]
MASSQYQIPDTPRVISPSPTPSESGARDSYFTSSKRSTANGHMLAGAEPIPEAAESDHSDPDLSRARSRSRSPQIVKRVSRRTSGLGPAAGARAAVPSAAATSSKTAGRTAESSNGHLSPTSAQGLGSSYWRTLSRSPSPLGLIPIHREWRSFIHRHEIPRKFLHVSIGFLTLYLYLTGTQPAAIHPVLLAMLVPIASVDFLRMRWPALNSLYIRLLGALMRESEAHDRYNGVISYLAGAWAVMRFCQKDVAVMAILLLSWCDTAASTFGRLWGKYTPRIRKGKSLAGTLAAFVVGVAAALAFWAAIAPAVPPAWNAADNAFAFDGSLTLHPRLRAHLRLSKAQSTLQGPAALAVAALTSGLIACCSEAVDLWGLDDNLTIPLLSGAALSAFFWAFGSR